MKRIIFIIAIALASSLAIIGCTEEEVRPSLGGGGENGGAAGSDSRL